MAYRPTVWTESRPGLAPTLTTRVGALAATHTLAYALRGAEETKLPDRPDLAAAEPILRAIRRAHLDRGR